LNATGQYFENYIAEQREEILRWQICLAVVVLVHGAAGFALRQYAEAFGTSEDQDLSVVMLVLPEQPQPPVEEKKEEPPPPQEEDKPPEPEPEVAMPTPEPPRSRTGCPQQGPRPQCAA
jgi:outer membrane biosynthesis protein TonB